MTLEERLRAVEEKLAALEQHPEPPKRKEKLWALNYLEKHAPDSGQVVYAGTAHLGDDGSYVWQVELSTEGILAQPWSEASDALAALAHPVRLELLKLILQGKRSTHDLAELEGLGTTGQLYHHLKELQSAGWIKAESRGHYHAVANRVIPLLTIVLAALGENLET